MISIVAMVMFYDADDDGGSHNNQRQRQLKLGKNIQNAQQIPMQKKSKRRI